MKWSTARLFAQRPPDLREDAPKPAVLDALLREDLHRPLLLAVRARVRRQAIARLDLSVVAQRVEFGGVLALSHTRAVPRGEHHARHDRPVLQLEVPRAGVRGSGAQERDVQMNVWLWWDRWRGAGKREIDRRAVERCGEDDGAVAALGLNIGPGRVCAQRIRLGVHLRDAHHRGVQIHSGVGARDELLEELPVAASDGRCAISRERAHTL